MGETVTLRGRKKLYIFVEEAINASPPFLLGGGSLTHTHTRVHTYTRCCRTVRILQCTVLLLQSKKKTPENQMFNLYLCTTLTTLEGEKKESSSCHALL